MRITAMPASAGIIAEETTRISIVTFFASIAIGEINCREYINTFYILLNIPLRIFNQTDQVYLRLAHLLTTSSSLKHNQAERRFLGLPLIMLDVI